MTDIEWDDLKIRITQSDLFVDARPLVAEQDDAQPVEDGESTVKHGVEFRKSTFWNK